jgi:hypothetical protein
MQPLPAELLAEIRAYLAGLKQLDGQRARFEIVDGGVSGGSDAPHYILAYCGNAAEAYINVGYTLQRADLYLQGRGLGGLWLGLGKPDEKADRNGFAIAYAFGGTAVPARSGERDFKRLDITAIGDADNAVARAVRVAPSAMNSQPWRLRFTEGGVQIHYEGRGILKAILKRKMSKIDLGIATAHAELALEHAGTPPTSVTASSDGQTFSAALAY